MKSEDYNCVECSKKKWKVTGVSPAMAIDGKIFSLVAVKENILASSVHEALEIFKSLGTQISADKKSAINCTTCAAYYIDQVN